MKSIIKVILIIRPWAIRRIILNKLFDYAIHPTAKIGFAWVFPRKLIMHEHSKIDHFTVVIHLDKVEVGAKSTIGRSNWITGFPTGTNSKHFQHQVGRKSELFIGKSSAITKHHHIDCTNSITIGEFVTIAGYQSQLLTHSIDVYENQQSSKPILIEDYAFIGTNVIIVGGATLPAHSVLGAKSLLNKSFQEEWKIYAGVPAKMIADIPKSAKYFSRKDGFVY